MAVRKFADAAGITELWSKVKSYISGVLPTKTSDLTNDSGYITGMEILSYGISTWDDFTEAYNAKKVVYCRASSNSNPASGSQTRLAFMAYVNNAATPTEVEFQYYRSINTHTESQQGDQVFVYKLTSANKWTVTTREAASKVAAGGDLTRSYSNGTVTISGTIPTVPTNVSAFTNDAGYITGYTETDPIFSASAAAGIQSTDITKWNSKVGLSELSIGYIDGNTIYVSDKFKYNYQGSSEYTGKFYFVVPSEYANSTRDVANTTVTKVVISTAQITISSVTFTISGLYEGYVSDNTLSYTRIASISDIPTNVSDLTNDAGYVTTDEKVSTTAVTSGSTYYPTLGTNTTSAETKYYDNKGLSYVSTQGSSNTSGSSILTLGQAANYGTANGRYGQIDLYSQTGKKGSIYQVGNYTADRTYALPNKSGTIALTTDIPTVPTNVSAFTNDAGYITGYTETDPIFSASAAHGISSADITNWNNKSDFSGSYNDLTNKPTIPVISIDTVLWDSQGDYPTEYDGAVLYAASGLEEEFLTSNSLLSVGGTVLQNSDLKTVNNTSLIGSGNVAVQPTLVSGTNIKTVNGNSLLGSGDLPIQGGGSKNVWYGYCDTAVLADEKVVTTTSGDFELADGNIIIVTFTNLMAGSPYLNVDETGAVVINYNSDSERAYQAYSTIAFVYDEENESFMPINRRRAIGNWFGLVTGNEIPHDISQVSITVANWNATTTCTKTVTGVTTSNSVIVSPAPASIADYVSAGVYCSAQGSGTLTFTASSTPTADLVVNVMVVG